MTTLKPIKGKAGQEVRIYQDPISQQRSEGEAILKQFISKVDDLEYWEVEFVTDVGETYPRAVYFS